MDDTNKRFDRLEDKIDKLSDAMFKLVEIDTKLGALVDHNATQDRRLDNHSERLDKQGDQIIRNSGTSRITERVFFVILIAVVGYMGSNLNV